MSNDIRSPQKITSWRQITMQMVMPLVGLRPPSKFGRNIQCPFSDHNDHAASCTIWKTHFRCWGGACGKKGDAIKFIQLFQGFNTRREAKQWIRKELGMPSGNPEREKRDDAVDEKIKVLEQFWNWCERIPHLRELEELERTGSLDDNQKNHLKNLRDAFQYLEKRGFDRDFCEKHDIRYFGTNFQALLERIPEAERAEFRAALDSIGMISSNDNFLFTDRILFPLHHYGRLVNITGRTWRPGDIRERDMKYAFPRNVSPKLPETMFNLDECRELSSAYMVEGPIDDLALIKHEITSVVAICGSKGLSKGKIRALRRTKVKEVTIVFDSDPNEAGQKGTMDAGKLLFENGFSVKVKSLPFRNGNEKQDVNSFFQDGGTVEKFNEVPVHDWFDLFLNGINISATDSPVIRTAALQEAYKLIGRLPSSAHEHYTTVLLAKFPGLKKTEVVENIKQAHTKHVQSEKITAYSIKERITSRDHIAVDEGGSIFRYSAGVYTPWPEQEVGKEVIRIMQREHLDPYPKMLADVISLIKTANFIPEDRFNPPGFLNTKNRLINLETGKTENHTPSFISTIQLDFEAVGVEDKIRKTEIDKLIAKLCPNFLDALRQILPPEPDRRLMRMVWGYCLIPSVLYQVAFLWLGAGSNGKSLLAATLNAMLGDANCSHLFLSDLKERFRLSQLRFKLVNIVPEVRSAELLDDGIFKALVAGDPVTIEQKYRPPISFRNYAKFIILANNPPKTRDFSHGLFRRLIIVPFTQVFEGEAADRELFQKIVPKELPGILLWAAQGLQDLRKAGGFPETDSTSSALHEYRLDVDGVAQFVQDQIEFGNFGEIDFRNIYGKFSWWCSANGVSCMSSRSFGRRFRNVTKLSAPRQSCGNYFYEGCRIRPDNTGASYCNVLPMHHRTGNDD